MISETAGNGDQVSFVMSLRYIQKWIPAFAGMTVGWIPAFAGMTVGWIPAFAGMTSPFPDYGMITAHTNTVSTRTQQNERTGK
jgi:hypothetical protein